MNECLGTPEVFATFARYKQYMCFQNGHEHGAVLTAFFWLVLRHALPAFLQCRAEQQRQTQPGLQAASIQSRGGEEFAVKHQMMRAAGQSFFHDERCFKLEHIVITSLACWLPAYGFPSLKCIETY